MDPHKIDFGSYRKVQSTYPLNFAVCFFSATSIPPALLSTNHGAKKN